MAELHHDQWLWRFEAHLHEQGYKSVTIKRHLSVCRQFVRYLQENDISVDQVSPPILDAYVQRQVQRYQQRYGHSPRDVGSAKHWFSSGIPPLLRFVQGQWPPPPPPANELERFHQRLCTGYADWLTQCRGLSPATIKLQHGRAQQLLAWLGERATPERVAELSVQDLDAYFMAIAPRYRRHTRAGVAHGVRDFLRYLHHQGMIGQDLAATVTCPTRYALESIPPALQPEDIDTVLDLTKQNRTPVGLRNCAILLLLAHYGLRSGEVVRLRLEDIDWRHDRFRIRQSKSGTETVLPLLAPVGNAVLDYLQHGRPQTAVREVFVCAYAPHRPLPALHHIVSRLLTQAGIEAEGRRGPHTFRHARAVSLLRERVSLQAVSHILGHRSAAQTRIYLKLATDDLRDVALEVPALKEVAP
jgi:integrase/recombinase XerD